MRDRRDPFRDLAAYELSSTERLKEENTELRDYLEEVAAADARGGPEEVFAVLDKRHERRRDDVRFQREGRQLWISVAAMVVACLALVATVIGVIIIR